MNTVQSYLHHITLPQSGSHKGQNGKLMIIGGSELFHAASRWSLDVASKFVDMIFYASEPSNNQLIREAKGKFWNGIVIERSHIHDYIAEADAILIGPGMTRTSDTEQLTNDLVAQYPHKKWVIDAGALQMIKPELLNQNTIITPHHKEWQNVIDKLPQLKATASSEKVSIKDAQVLHGTTIVLKGPVDQVVNAQHALSISGGNAGMTKGGTGDVLAGLIAALYTTHTAMTAAVVGSYVNKQAGDALYQKVGPYFNASDLVTAIPEALWRSLQERS
jgi:hydroxyethylthiazole kinase-like uncharacterized protein yjeF